MAKIKIGIDFSAELSKVDGLITEARKLGDKKTISELRIKHKELSRQQASGIVTILGDKKPAKKTQRGEADKQETLVEENKPNPPPSSDD